MLRYRLVCAKENEEMLYALCRAHSIALDDASPYVLCEEGVFCDGPCDILISFKKEKIEALMECLKGGHTHEASILMGASNGHYTPVEVARIAYIHACGNDTFARTTDRADYKIKQKLYELEGEILPRCFIRINKSEIVNIKHILKITPMFKGKLVLTVQGCPQPIDISRNYVKSFKERIGM